jgi:thiol:disulfide interchange protein DsbC
VIWENTPFAGTYPGAAAQIQQPVLSGCFIKENSMFRDALRLAARSGLAVVAVAAVAACVDASANEATIRKNLTERLPNFPKPDEVRQSPMPGLWEVRVGGTEILYTDAEGNYLIQGNLIDTKLRKNLTEERVDKLTAVKWDDLPLKDAIVITRGTGARKLAIFEDPNCGYCKRFERDLLNVNNVTVYMFLYPILSPDSTVKSNGIWCAKDRNKAWADWMVRDQAPPAPDAKCDVNAVVRNVEAGRKYKITGTPTIIFQDGSRVPGAINAQQIEQRLAALAAPAPAPAAAK